ncbi:MAG TPA: MFS transporter [Micromonosporaceae bacterium]
MSDEVLAARLANRWAATVGGLLVVLLLVFTAFGAVVPVLPPLVLDRLHGSRFAVGLAFAASGIAALLGRPYAGRLAQRFGGRVVMAGGCLLAALVGVAYALPVGLSGLIVTRVAMGVAESLVFTAGSVWVVALAPARRRGEIVGYYGLAMWSGWTVGPLVGQALLADSGYGRVWLLAAVGPVVATAVVLALPRPAGTGGAVSDRLVPRSVLLPGTALALSAFGYAALTGFVALHLAARGIGHGAVMLSLFGAAYVTVRLVAGRLPDRVGPRPVVVWCGLAEGLGLLLITVAPAWWVAAVGALVMGGGFTLLYPALALAVIRRSPEQERGAALGAYTSFWDLGLGVAGLVTGAVALVGYGWVFALSAVLAWAAAGLGAWSRRLVEPSGNR